MTRQLDFFYFLGSTYTHLAVHRAAALARGHGIELIWRPFSVRTLMREQNNSPFASKPLKMAYMWRDIERRAARFGVPFNGRPPYPIDADERANRIATLASMEGWCEPFTRAAYAAWFIDHRDPGTVENAAAIVGSLGHDADRVLRRAEEPEVRERYADATAQARTMGLFGSPTFACGGEIFWGDDRLDDAIAWCLAH